MPVPTPNANESQEVFIERCHRALADSHPETDERNSICFATWREHKASVDRLERIATEKFGTDKFQIVRDVPVFCEHERNGEQYTKDDLKQIVNKLNRRILDRGLFPAISDGHTPDSEDLKHGAKMPEVLGYAGNYRLGAIGNEDPVWAIFQDEYRYKDKAEYLSKKPRRSVEIYLHENMSDRFWDPVAALGSEPPYLDLPMKFSVHHETGCRIAKYCAFPSEGNAFTPNVISSEKEQYMHSPEETRELAEQLAPHLMASLAPMIAQAVQAALMPTPAPVVAPPPAPEPAAEPAMPEEPVASDPIESEFLGDEEEPENYQADEEVKEEYSDEEEEEEPKDDYMADAEPPVEPEKLSKPAAGAQPKKYTKEAPMSRVERAKYERDIKTLKENYAKLEKRQAAIEKERKLTERYSRLVDLERKGYQLESGTVKVGDEEKELYSADFEFERSKAMSDAEFDRHLETLVRYARRESSEPFVVAQTLDFPFSKQAAGQNAKAHYDALEEAKTRAIKYRNEGKKGITYADVVDEVYKERNLTRIA